MYPPERASEAYKKGYRDCRDRRSRLYQNDGTFKGYDYSQGWEACWNEEYWDAVRDNDRRNKGDAR